MIKIRQTLAARVVRQVAFIQSLEARPETILRLQERYCFLKVPKTYEEMFPTDPMQGVKFLQGEYKQDGKSPIPVDVLQLLPNLILVQTHTSTDDAEKFLDDYMHHANKERPDTIVAFGAPLYLSEIEFFWDRELDDYAHGFRGLSPQLNALMTQYGSVFSGFRIATISLSCDPSVPSPALSGHFSVERRVGLPDNLKVFYSRAPLKTRDHEALLHSLDAEKI